MPEEPLRWCYLGEGISYGTFREQFSLLWEEGHLEQEHTMVCIDELCSFGQEIGTKGWGQVGALGETVQILRCKPNRRQEMAATTHACPHQSSRAGHTLLWASGSSSAPTG